MIGNRIRDRAKKTHEVVASVLNPINFKVSKKEAKVKAFSDFVYNAPKINFDKSIDIILKDNDIFETLNQSKCETNIILSKQIFSTRSISKERLLTLFNAIFHRERDKLKCYLERKEIIEELFLKGIYTQVESMLDEIVQTAGNSLWEVNLRVAVLTARKDYKQIDEQLEQAKINNASELFLEIHRVTAWKSHSVDPNLVIETMVRRPNKEYIEGGALDLAAFHCITSLQCSIYDDVDLQLSLGWLQTLPLIDLYESLKKIAVHGICKKNLDPKVSLGLLEIFITVRNSYKCDNLDLIINSLKQGTPLEKKSITDNDIEDYTKGNYNTLLDRFEADFASCKNLVTKVNMIAKAYVYTNRKPTSLPALLASVIDNLISIYSLKNTNQNILQQINLALTYSSLELSDHLIISIIKSAPFYFSNEKSKDITYRSNYLSFSLTPLSHSLHTPPSIFVYEKNYTLPEHREVKNKAIKYLLNNYEESWDLIEKYGALTPIKKDVIELKVEYFISNEDLDGLTDFASNELILNSNANICLPLSEISKFIEQESLYSLNAVICSYYFNKFSMNDETEILNEVFEEYIVSQGVKRPSELVTSNLNIKELFFLKEIAKIDVMDYLGCFEDDKDLKIERINILNKLVSSEYLKQNSIDSECKYIVDDILIESEAAKFNNAKIFVDTKFILEKTKFDLDSLLAKYFIDQETDDSSKEMQYEIESMTILKGDKNILVTRFFNTLLLEFINNIEVGLDINLSSEIRHGFFGNLICSGPQNRNLLTELDEHGNYKSNEYWMSYYSIISSGIMEKIDSLLMDFSKEFNNLIDSAEHWMKTALNKDDDDDDRIFIIDISLDDFNQVKYLIESYHSTDEVASYVFKIFNDKLEVCLSEMKSKLNIEFVTKMDDMFSLLIENINISKGGTSMSHLIEELQMANTEVKECIRTVCEWFSFKKSTHFESIEVKKLIMLADRCFKQINNCDIRINVSSEITQMIEGKHLYALVFTMINCFNNSFKYMDGSKTIWVSITGNTKGSYSIEISNIMNVISKHQLDGGKFDEILSTLAEMSKNELLTNEGGSGLYKSLHSLKLASSKFSLTPKIDGNNFLVEINYAN
ncbi:hypothetical protein [Pantoea sp. WMus005]|uniref:hypothetical protein n=1 Tax=Pantoea sp. WMus005 TaxID=2750734 RepID=UPI002102C21B|nr:hypothetical protein [Pantoea sp. WMus005]